MTALQACGITYTRRGIFYDLGFYLSTVVWNSVMLKQLCRNFACKKLPG